MDAKLSEEQVKSLPAKTGVYLMKDAEGHILYVGKAVGLRDRVRSYLHPSGQPLKVRRLMAQVSQVDYILTDSEMEALLLECNLIKKHRPKYNVRLRDDKYYPYIKVNFADPWPRVYITRRVERDGARYFGPFTNSKSVRRTLDLAKKLFPYRSCTKPITGKDSRPCLDYHIHRCLGPCIGAVTNEEYLAVVRQVGLFLEGKHEEVLKDLRRKMEAAAEALEFERAARLRDQIHAVERTIERQKMISSRLEDQDVIAFARSNGDACVEVFFIRGGKVIGREHFALEGTQEEDARRIMASFLTQFYDRAPYVPPEIILQNEADEMDIIEAWLRDKRGDKVSLKVPRRGEKRRLMEEVAANAAEALAQMQAKWLADKQKTTLAVQELADSLLLDEPPQRIECYDVANIQGRWAVGSLVVFENGQPQKSLYRRFQIKAVAGVDDYAMLQEVLRRRFKRALGAQRDEASGDREGPQTPAPWATLPDLVVVDGGRGQLNVALDVMNELGVSYIPTVALAKEREEIYTPELPEPVRLPRASQGLYLMQRIRDEAHRFAITYHRRWRQRRSLDSLLDQVPGIGHRRKAALLRRFGSLQAIRDAPLDELAQVEGMNLRAARALKEYL